MFGLAEGDALSIAFEDGPLHLYKLDRLLALNGQIICY
jgi:hypothetical protein